MKLFTHNDFSYYRSELDKILERCVGGGRYYTHAFEHCSGSFIGKDSRHILRRALRSLQNKGLLEHFDLGLNIHQWQITEFGKQYISDENRKHYNLL